jgi:peptidyl-tRNA hydrolase, PTH1 family
MKLFVGLGNPGSEYARHRHNVGFMAVDRIAERYGLSPWKKRFHSLTCEGVVGGKRVVLLKPQTFMNESGRSVGEACRYLKIAEADIYVFHDELDLVPGKLKVKTGGGNAGHNGLRSISAHIGNEFARVRIGIGHPGVKEQVLRHVLHDFAKADAVWLKPLLDAIADAAPRLAAGDDARFLTDVARATKAGEAAPKTATAAPAPVRETVALPAPSIRHPAGERQGKRASALAENLKRWLKGRSEKS